MPHLRRLLQARDVLRKRACLGIQITSPLANFAVIEPRSTSVSPPAPELSSHAYRPKPTDESLGHHRRRRQSGTDESGGRATAHATHRRPGSTCIHRTTRDVASRIVERHRADSAIDYADCAAGRDDRACARFSPLKSGRSKATSTSAHTDHAHAD